jgi:hypothetical protein
VNVGASLDQRQRGVVPRDLGLDLGFFGSLLRDTMIELGELCRMLTPLRFEQGCRRALADERHRNEHQIGFFRSLPPVYPCPGGINLVETIQPRRLGNPPPRNGASPMR